MVKSLTISDRFSYLERNSKEARSGLSADLLDAVYFATMEQMPANRVTEGFGEAESVGSPRAVFGSELNEDFLA
jgi:hypothetical protein